MRSTAEIVVGGGTTFEDVMAGGVDAERAMSDTSGGSKGFIEEW